MKRIRLNLFAAKHKLEGLMERDIPITEIARETGLNVDGLYRSFKNEYGGVQFDTLARLMEYFEANGLNMEIGDFFVVETGDEESKQGKDAPTNQALAVAMA